MKLYIPEIGDQIQLVEDWAFDIFNEYRNHDFLDILYSYQPTLQNSMERDKTRYQRDIEEWNAESNRLYEQSRTKGEIPKWRYGFDGSIPYISFLLPAGTILKVDRIYIRKGLEDFSSVTFYLTDCPIPELSPFHKKTNPKGIKGKRRFWAKLSDINHIEFKHA